MSGWIANLSNGDVVLEEPPVAGEMSSWQKLLSRCKRENLQITGLRLGRIVAASYKSCDGYFQARRAVMTIFGGSNETWQGIGSVLGDKVFVNWLDPSGRVHQEIIDYIDVDVHCYRRPNAELQQRRPG